MVLWNRRDARGLTANVAIAIAVAGLANAFVFVVNRREDIGRPTQPFQPPGYVIGIVWVCLFIFMGTARWLALAAGDRPFRGAAWIWGLLLFCAAYPIYTLGLKSLIIGFAGNVATAILSVWVALNLRRTSLAAAGLISTVALWVTFAGFLILEQVRGTP
jgi:tryptophan-rich sensory protein